MVKVVKDYDVVLHDVLASEDLSHAYMPLYQEHGVVIDGTPIGHNIYGKIKVYKNSLLFKKSCVRIKEVRVAEINSEPETTKGLFKESRLRYDGLEIRVLKTSFNQAIMNVAEKIESELEEPVTVISAE